MYKKFFDFCRKNWIMFALLAVFLLSYGLRVGPYDSKWLSAYDPYMQYRYTKDFVDDGVLSSWDELSYYPPGRTMSIIPPLMYYMTGILFMAFGPLLGLSLMSFCGYMAAVYGAIAVIPAYFLGKEFSDKKAGLLAAFFVGMSPAIITRTMGGFFDSDGLVIFFTILSMYLLVRAFRKKTYLDYGIGTVGLILFGLTWMAAWYVPIIVIISTVAYFLVLLTLGLPEWEPKTDFSERFKKSFKEFRQFFIPIILMFIAANIFVMALGYNLISSTTSLITFAQDPASLLIVNISVAELQTFDIMGGIWTELFSRIGALFVFTIPGAMLLLKRDRKNGVILLTWTLISFFAITRGIRFMLVFAPAACIASAIALSESYKYLKNGSQYSPLISFGFLGSVLVSIVRPEAGVTLSLIIVFLFMFVKKKEESDTGITGPVFIAAVILLIVLVFSQGSQVALAGGMTEPINQNWENTYSWIESETSKDAVVGSWWDPGHRIAGSGRRNIADGAHCSDEYCKPGLNTRIVDLGKIFTTSNETQAKNLLLKYRGNASEMYWISSDDLIGKFRWLQYFGTGCDGTGIYTPNGQTICPLYSMIPAQSYSYDQNYTIKAYQYGSGISALEQDGQWIVVMQDTDKNYLFQKEVIYSDGLPQIINFSWSNDTIPGTIWLHPDNSYIVFIPPALENSMFTRMFFYEDATLEYFEPVFKNGQVKIHRLKMD